MTITSPIERVSFEILSQILLLTIRPESSDIWNTWSNDDEYEKELLIPKEASDTRKLMLVSKYWRLVIESTPRLWTSMSFSKGPQHSHPRLQKWPSYSGALHLKLVMTVDSDIKLREMWTAVVKPILPRLASVTLISSESHVEIKPHPKDAEVYWKDLETAAHLTRLETFSVILDFENREFRPLLANLQEVLMRNKMSHWNLPCLRMPSLSIFHWHSFITHGERIWDLVTSSPKLRKACIDILAIDLSMDYHSKDLSEHPIEELNLTLPINGNPSLQFALLGNCYLLKSLALQIHKADLLHATTLSEFAYLTSLSLAFNGTYEDQCYPLAKGAIKWLQSALCLETFTITSKRDYTIELVLQAFLIGDSDVSDVISPRLKHLIIKDSTLTLPSLLKRVMFERSTLRGQLQNGVSSHSDVRESLQIPLKISACNMECFSMESSIHFDEVLWDDFSPVIHEMFARAEEQNFDIDPFAEDNDPLQRLRHLILFFGFPLLSIY